MDINKQWLELEQAKFSNSSLNKEMIMQAIHNESKSTISLLKKRLYAKLNWIKFFILGFITMSLFNYQNLAIVSIMIVAIGIYGLAFWMLWQDYKKLGVGPNFEDSAMQHMKANLTAIKSAIKKETIWGLTIMPIAILLGSILSGLLRGKATIEALTITHSWSFILTIVLLSIFVMYLAIKANDRAFGQQIKQLERQIGDLEEMKY